MRLQKEMALLIYLAETSRAHTRMALATLFWPEMDQSAAFAALRRTLYQLKSDIGENLLEVTPRIVSIRQDVAVWRDTQRFLNAARQCADHEHPPDAPLASCLSAMREATTLYTDDFLASPCLTARCSMSGSFSRGKNCARNIYASWRCLPPPMSDSATGSAAPIWRDSGSAENLTTNRPIVP
jgi:hypothetical protein